MCIWFSWLHPLQLPPAPHLQEHSDRARDTVFHYEPALWSQPKVFIWAWTIWLFSGWKGVSSPPKFQHQAKGLGLGASARELVSALWTSPPFPPVLPQNNSGKDRSQPLKSIPGIFKDNPDISSAFPELGLFPRAVPPPPAFNQIRHPLLLLQRRKGKKSWQFNSNKRSLKSISTATPRLLANRILISMLLFFF